MSFHRNRPEKSRLSVHFNAALHEIHKIVAIHSAYRLDLVDPEMSRPQQQLIPGRSFASGLFPVRPGSFVAERVIAFQVAVCLPEHVVKAQNDVHRQFFHAPGPMPACLFPVGFTFGTAEYRDDERGVPPFVAQVQVGRFAQFDGRRMR